MTGRIITVASGKGGVGKTTTTANVGAALALLGRKTVLMDGDIGLRNLDIVMGLESRITYDVVDVIAGRCRLEQALIRDRRAPELYVLPAAQSHATATVSAADITAVCDQLRERFEFVVVDSPAGIGPGFLNAIAPADEIIVVANPEVASVRDAGRVIDVIAARDKGPGKLVINRLIAERVTTNEALSPQDIGSVLSIEIIGIVPEDKAMLSASNRGAPVVFNGKGPAAVAFRDIARRLSGEDVPVAAPQATPWWQRLINGDA